MGWLEGCGSMWIYAVHCTPRCAGFRCVSLYHCLDVQVDEVGRSDWSRRSRSKAGGMLLYKVARIANELMGESGAMCAR